MLIIVVGYGVFDELHQASTPGRSVDTMDILADAAGGLLAAVTAVIHRKVARKRISTAGSEQAP